MKFEIFQPTEKLKPYVTKMAISEVADMQVYKVLASTGMVMGFQ
jgi:hypothetical protein